MTAGLREPACPPFFPGDAPEPPVSPYIKVFEKNGQ